jgi:D-alanyl-D-alanine carboxypeptidase
MQSEKNSFKSVYIGSFIALSLFTGYLLYLTLEQDRKIEVLLADRNFFLLETSSSTKSLEHASSTITDLTIRLASTTEELEDIEQELRREKNKNEDFEDQIKEISGTVGILDKLSKTDEELLQKYSRTYFLNENFIPMKLRQVDSDYILPGKKDQYFHGDAIDFLTDMLDEASEDGVEIKIVSAYRSFDEQAELKGQFTQVYGSGANTFSADQGYSEHQLGTAVDLTDPITSGTYTSFASTESYRWLQDNAYKFGFILSYPEDNNFYIYEPWHWRFVGTDLARDLHRAGAKFYEWEQRKIDEYLIKIFD